MSLSGHVENGVIVLDAGFSLPEGTKVAISPVAADPETIQPGTGDWDAALRAAHELENYDFEAFRRQRDYDLAHARDHLP
jgi:hypothetical protein